MLQASASIPRQSTSARFVLPALTVAVAFLLAGFTLPGFSGDIAAAGKMLKTGDARGALTEINRYLDDKPADAQGRFLRGVILTRLGDYDAAVAVFKDLTAEYPDLPEPYNNLAVIYARQQQYDEARDALEMAIRTHPAYATAHENLGDIYSRLASQAYGKALQIDAGNASAQTKLALISELVEVRQTTAIVDADKTPPAAASSSPASAPAAPAASSPKKIIAAAPATPSVSPPREKSAFGIVTGVVQPRPVLIGAAASAAAPSGRSDIKPISPRPAAAATKSEAAPPPPEPTPTPPAPTPAPPAPTPAPPAPTPAPPAPTPAPPAPTPAPPEPAPAPAAPTAPEAPAPVAAKAADADKKNEKAVLAAIDAWLKAWSDNDVDAYLASYAANFTPRGGQSLADWKAQRKRRVGGAKGINVSRGEAKVKMLDGDRAEASFHQSYRSSTFKGATDKILTLELIDGDWRILKEDVGE